MKPPVYRQVVTISQPQCPDCGSTELHSQASRSCGDGSRIRQVVCNDPTCRCRFDIVTELLIHDMDFDNRVTVRIPASITPEAEPMTTINILSTGQTASRLSLRVGDLRTVASELSIEPAAIINSVVYYSEADVQRMAERVERERTPEKQ